MKLRLYALTAFGIVVGAAARAPAAYIYWTDSNAWHAGGDVRRANLDGTGQTTLISGLVGPGGIALDAAGGKMYWTDGDQVANTGDIRRANLDGTGSQVLKTAFYPVGIALDPGAGKMYWLTHYQNETMPWGLD